MRPMELGIGQRPAADAEDGTVPSVLAGIGGLLRCPQCSGSLQVAGKILCTACGAVYPVRQGIACLVPAASAETAAADVGASSTYQAQYQGIERATRYNEAYRERPLKRQSTKREYRLLERLLEGQSRCGTLLDLPCGGGRLSPLLEQHSDLLIEADIGLGQLLYGRSNTPLQREPVRMTASAFTIPFRDESIDAVVCVRLSHHLPFVDERERLIGELLRVSRRFAIMSFFDFHSLKNLWRRMRHPFDRKPPKLTMTVERVAQVARSNGAELAACPALASPFSGHRYALMLKTGGR